MLECQWIPRWNRTLSAAKGLGAKSVRLGVEPPADACDVACAEAELRRAIPVEFRRTLLEFSRKVDFFWFLPDTAVPPGELHNIFYGDCSWDIGQLVAMNQQVQWLADNAFSDDEPEYRIWQHKFPFQSIANGDFLAINTAPGERQYVVYLSHEVAGSHGYRLGSDFLDFMERLTSIGCPSDDIWPKLIRSREQYIDLDHPNVRAWCEWLGLPKAET